MSFRALAAICLLAVALPATAQGPTSGSVAGRITESTGGILAGVTVTLSGPSLQGVRSAVTDAEGIYRFQNVPPGHNYTIAAAHTGLRATRRTGIQVFLGHTVTINLVLAPAPMSQEVRVTAPSPLLDLTATSMGVNITANQLLSLPTVRGFQQLTTMAPGVLLDMGDHDQRLERSPTVGAASAPENNYIIDGLSTTDPRYGISGANVTMNFVQEVQVLTGGYQAEFGRSTGGLFTVITKSGSNVLQGDLFGYYRGKSWSPANVERRRQRELVTYADRASDGDLGASLGGALVRDRLWFFGAADPGRQTTYLGGQLQTGVAVNAANRQYDRTANAYAAKVTWAPSTTQTLVVSAFGDPTERNGWLANPNADASAALRVERTGGHNVTARYSNVLGRLWYLEATAGRHFQRMSVDPVTDSGRNTPRQIDQTLGGFEHGGFRRHQDDRATRDAYSAQLFSSAGGHELRYGIDVEVNTYDANLQETWYRFFGPAFGFGSYLQERDYSVTGRGRTTNTAAYAQDNWRVSSNLRVNAGLRFERQQLTSGNRVAIAGASDAAACFSSGNCRTVGSLAPGGTLAPRLGLTWDPSRRGVSKVYAFWGRFFESIPLDLNIRAINGERSIITQYVNTAALTSTDWYNAGGSPLAINTPWSVYRAFTQFAMTPVDEHLKSQFEDQFAIGAEYQVGGHLSVGARYVDRSVKRVVEGIGTFTNPADRLQLTGYVITNPGFVDFGAAFERPSRHYRALEFTASKALADNWFLASSFVYAHATGNYEGLYLSENDQLDPNITLLYDIPSFVPNQNGALRADRPYQFKIHSAYTVRPGLTLSEGLLVSAGVPVSAMGPELVYGYGDGSIFMLPRGSKGRTPTYWNFDIHADYRLPVGRDLSVVLDVFNVFNLHAVLDVDQNYIFEGMPNFDLWINGLPGSEPGENLDVYGNPKFNGALPRSPFFGTPILFQAPRAVQVGVRVRF
jgi:outer membrane receptor protein involved in Fe transport